ncbi:multiple sugar transport system ATP-binding protein [Halogranum rubrum]|uniref:ABC-type D-xylose/L-arabinose transporter n=1 Tax=Halogranum rubrum TaxID=553466 RepID=A0A1I4E2A1_9EURY|nr:ABC transporter ATP-binding protein [Halogranum rubrum]SFK99905.1 multiple sugar transport system ATP-binding protein [Halogranum rubrum]
MTPDQPVQTRHAASAGGDETDDYVQLSDIRKTFSKGRVLACDDVNLDIGQSDFVVLLGPSGCGKTTTLRMIAGLETPDSGSITIDGEDVTGLKPRDRNLAYVFQNITLYPHMTVRKNIRFGLDMKTDLSADEKRERVEHAAGLLGLSELLDRKPKALSGGQQQRVSLGRAMVMEPDAFLLDEPFSALDAKLRDQMRVEVKKLQRELDTAMIFVTHDQEEAMTLGDKIVIMDGGHIQQVGSAYEIYNEPTNQFVAEFIGSPSANMVEATVVETDSGLVVENEWFSLPLTGDDPSLTGGETVTVGFRPEYLELDVADGQFELDVTVIEPHGKDDAVYLASGDTEFTAITEQGTITDESETLSVRVAPENVWLFDHEGQRLR